MSPYQIGAIRDKVIAILYPARRCVFLSLGILTTQPPLLPLLTSLPAPVAVTLHTNPGSPVKVLTSTLVSVRVTRELFPSPVVAALVILTVGLNIPGVSNPLVLFIFTLISFP